MTARLPTPRAALRRARGWGLRGLARVPEALARAERRVVLAGPLLFTGIVMVQGFHMMEHVVQVAQLYLLGFHEAHGLLGVAVDREYVHLGYNSFLLAGLLLVAVAFAVPGHLRDRQAPRWMLPLAAVVPVQMYHEVEHAMKFMQFLATGAHDTPGILGNFATVFLVHFGLNAVVYGLLLAAWLGWRRARAARVVDRPWAAEVARTLARERRAAQALHGR